MTDNNVLVSPVKRTLLSEIVAQDLEALILTGELKPGTKLPSEQSLARQFDVSRNVVREGLRRLKEGGLVVVRPGDGVYVGTPDQATVVNALSRYIQLNRAENWIDELYEVRRLLEPGTAALAAERAMPEEVQALEAALERMRAHADDPAEWARADWDFHAVLARAAHNSLLPMLLKPLDEQVFTAFAEGWRHPRGSESGLRFHAELIVHVRAHDAKAAREAMLAHLKVSYTELSEVWRQRSTREASNRGSSERAP